MKTNFGLDKKQSITKNETKQKQPIDRKISFLSENTIKALNASDNKSIILLSPIKDANRIHKEIKKSEKKTNEHNTGLLVKNRISEHSFEHDIKQARSHARKENCNNEPVKQTNKEKDNFRIENKKEKQQKKEDECIPKRIQNNLQKFNLNNPNMTFNLNLDKFERLKNKNTFNVSSSSNLNQFGNSSNFSNHKIKIKISNETSLKNTINKEKIKGMKEDSNEENIGKNININISHKITNFYNMMNTPLDFDKKQSENKKNLHEDGIENKVGGNKSKMNSGMVRFLDGENIKEKEKRIDYYDN